MWKKQRKIQIQIPKSPPEFTYRLCFCCWTVLWRSMSLTCPDSVLCIIRWWRPSRRTGFSWAVLPQHVVKLSWIQGGKLCPERSPGRLDGHEATEKTFRTLKDMKQTFSKTRIVKAIHFYNFKEEPQKHFVVIVRMTEWEKQAFSQHACFHIKTQSHCYSLICMKCTSNQFYDLVNMFSPCHLRARCGNKVSWENISQSECEKLFKFSHITSAPFYACLNLHANKRWGYSN